MNFDSKTSNDYQFKELSSLTGVKPYVLRFWESEFEQISPSLGEDGTKTYSENDRKSVEQIKDLLFGQKLSIQEAKGMLQKALEEASLPTTIEESPKQANEPTLTNSDERVFSFESSFELMQKSYLLNTESPAPVKPSINIDYTEKDMLSLLHAKKKLKVSLAKINEVFDKYNW